MKGYLYIQRKKGKLQKAVSIWADINGGENRYDRKLYAQDGSCLIGELYLIDMVIGADGIMFKGYEKEGGVMYFQEWWLALKL